jgi:hypothetical protein
VLVKTNEIDMNRNSFQVAISFSDEKSWIAEDIFNFLKEIGIDSFYYKAYPDYTGGNLEDNIKKVYNNSNLNVIIWSNDYAKKSFDSVVNTELQTMQNRHISNQEYDSLVIVNSDNSQIHNKFSKITFHNLNEMGIYKIRNVIIERLNKLYTYVDGEISQKMYHPKFDGFTRGKMVLCKFIIHKDFIKSHSWDKYGDIQVQITQSAVKIDFNLVINLLPSGRVTSLLADPSLLRSQEKNLKIKKNLSKDFITKNKNHELIGYLFFRFKNGVEYCNVYNFTYDDYLNKGLADIEDLNLWYKS